MDSDHFVEPELPKKKKKKTKMRYDAERLEEDKVSEQLEEHINSRQVGGNIW